MTKEELEKAAENFIIDRYKLNECYREDNAETREYMRMDVHSQYEEEYQLYLAGAEPREKRIAELEKKISILLSCKNCPNNKGGYICEKEYEEKCLSQKIQYIKELQEEIAELEKEIERLNKVQDDIQTCCAERYNEMRFYKDKYKQAKEIIKRLMDIINHDLKCFDTMAGLDIKQKAEQFLKEE